MLRSQSEKAQAARLAPLPLRAFDDRLARLLPRERGETSADSVGSGAKAPAPQLAEIARSLQAWQLGETSDGNHLRAAAALHSARVGDPDLPDAIDLFIREEQQHGELLGRFLDLAGVGRVKADWGDSLFRAARYCVTDMEVWTTPVVMVETLAVVYYNAIRLATDSPVLRAVCTQILADEGPHIRFQCERLAALLRNRRPWGRWVTMLCQRLFFVAVVVLVWMGHRRALRAGGYGWGRYWRAAWSKMNAAWRMMDPRRVRLAGGARRRLNPLHHHRHRVAAAQAQRRQAALQPALLQRVQQRHQHPRPDAPIGWPSAIAPPLTFTRASSSPSSLPHASIWAANASFSSNRSMSLSRSSAFSSTCRTASTGAMKMSFGATPLVA